MQAVGPRCRQCVLCGDAIEGKGRMDRVYCSASCRTLAWRVRVGKRWGGRPQPGTGAPPQDQAPGFGRPTLAGLRAELDSAAACQVVLQQQLVLKTTELDSAAAREAALQKRLDMQTAEWPRTVQRAEALQLRVNELTEIAERLARRERESRKRAEELAKENETLQGKVNGWMQAHANLLSADERRRRKLAAAREKAAQDRDERRAAQLGTSYARKQRAAAKKKPAGPRLARRPESAQLPSQAQAPRSVGDGPVSRPRPQFPAQTPVPNQTASSVRGQAAPMQRRPTAGVPQPTAQVALAVRTPMSLTAARAAEVAQEWTRGVQPENPRPKRKSRRKGPAKAPRKKKSSWLSKVASVVAGAAAGVAIGLGIARATKR